MLTDLSAPREAVEKNQTVGVYWPLLVGSLQEEIKENRKIL